MTSSNELVLTSSQLIHY